MSFATFWLAAQERGLERMEVLTERIARRPKLAPHLRTGLRGERAALFELRRRHYIVVARRWTSGRAPGDIDLVAWHGDKLCFIEVKTRTARDLTPAEAAVDDDKRETLRRLAHFYLLTFPETERSTISVRFDVISVYLVGAVKEFEIFEDAFARR